MSANPTPHVTCAIAREVAQLVGARHGDAFEVSYKQIERDGATVADVVTEVDLAAERLARELIEEAAPGAVVVGEESGLGVHAHAKYSEADLAAADECWLVDPLDGTANFTRGIPLFAVSIARMQRGVIYEACVIAPVLGEEYVLHADGQATWSFGGRSHQPLVAASTSALDDAFVAGGLFHERVAPKLHGYVGHGRRIGSAALALCWVAAGRLDAYLQPTGLSPWDLAAGVPLVRAAGGHVRDEDGREYAHIWTGMSGVVAAAPAIDGPLHAVLHPA